MKICIRLVIILEILIFPFVQGCTNRDTRSAIEDEISLHVLDLEDVPGKWLFDSNRSARHTYLQYSYIIRNGEVETVLPESYIGNAKWSPDGVKILAKSAGSTSGFIHVFVEGEKEMYVLETNKLVNDLSWIDNRHIIYSDGWTSDKEIGYVILCDLETKEKKVVFEVPFGYEASDIHISHDRNRAIFNINPIRSARGNTHMSRSVLVDLDSFKTKEINLIAGIAGWLQDNKTVIVTTNWKLDRSDFNNRFGVIARYNVETNELIAIKDNHAFYMQSTLSPDGRYIYYGKATEGGGVAIFVQSLESNDEWQITKPVYVSDKVGMSHDLPTSWIPDDNVDFLRDLLNK